MLRQELSDCCMDLCVVRGQYIKSDEPNHRFRTLLTYRIAEWKCLMEQMRLKDVELNAKKPSDIQILQLVQRGFQQLKANLQETIGVDLDSINVYIFTGSHQDQSRALVGVRYSGELDDYKTLLKVCEVLIMDVRICLHAFEYYIFQRELETKRNRIAHRKKNSHHFSKVSHWIMVLSFLLKKTLTVVTGKPMVLQHSVGYDDMWGTMEESSTFEKEVHILTTIVFQVVEKPRDVLQKIILDPQFPRISKGFNSKTIVKFLQNKWDDTIIEDDWKTYVPVPSK